MMLWAKQVIITVLLMNENKLLAVANWSPLMFIEVSCSVVNLSSSSALLPLTVFLCLFAML